MKNTISQKYIKDYANENFSGFRHSIPKFVKAIRKTANEFKLDKKDLFHYIVERASTIPMSQSYGFDTAYGREIRGKFKINYYKL